MTLLGKIHDRQCVLLVKSFNLNVFVIASSISFHDLCCMSCCAASPLSLLSLTAVFTLMKQKSQKLYNAPDRNYWSYPQSGSQQLIDSE